MKKLLLIALLVLSIAGINYAQTNNRTDSTIYDFKFYDTKVDQFNMKDLKPYKGKIMFIDFQYTGCGACIQYYQKVLKPVKEHFKDSDDVVFIAVSVDNDSYQWLGSIYKGWQTDDSQINLLALGGFEAPIIDFVGNRKRGYPYLILFGRNGEIITKGNEILRTKGATEEKRIENVINAIENAIKEKG